MNKIFPIILSSNICIWICILLKTELRTTLSPIRPPIHKALAKEDKNQHKSIVTEDECARHTDGERDKELLSNCRNNNKKSNMGFSVLRSAS